MRIVEPDVRFIIYAHTGFYNIGEKSYTQSKKVRRNWFTRVVIARRGPDDWTMRAKVLRGQT